MIKFGALMRLSCILGVHAATSALSNVDLTVVADSDGTGVGFLVKITGCADGGCETNSSALFKIQDDAQSSKHDGNCGQFDAFRDNSEDTDDNEDFFFIAFPMTAGNRGQYYMSKGCFQEAGGGVEANDGKIYPSADPNGVWTDFVWTAPGSVQFANQPAFTANSALGANKTDVYMPQLLLVTPHSKDLALQYQAGSDGNNYRKAQYRYVPTGEKLNFYFSETVTAVAGKSVYVYEFAPGTAWDADTEDATAQVLAADGFTAAADFLGTKHTASPTLKQNRLYKVLMDAGAFQDAEGNVARGVNGKSDGGNTASDSYSNCVFPTHTTESDCGIVFVVGLTLSGASYDIFPEVVEETNGYIDITAHTEITEETNVWIDFKQAVVKGTVTGSMKMTFGADPLDDADLEIVKSSGDDCFADNRCHELVSSTFYLFEPAAALADADTDSSNSTEITVSFGRGTFDYVNAFTHTFITNRTEYEGHAPEILAYSIGASVFRGTDAYYETAADYLASGAVTLWFDTQVTAVAGKHVTFTPMDYSGEDPQTLAASGSCFDAGSPTAASLAPCRLPAEESTLVTFEAGESDSKVTFNPGSLIPGQTYEVSVDEGAFVGKSAGDAGTPRASAAFSTRFYQAQTVQACVVGDASAGPLHRSSAIKVTFNGPVHVDDSKAISIGPYATTTVDGVTTGAFTTNYPQSLSNADVVYMRNNADAGSDQFMIIVEPRIADGTEVGMPANEAIEAHVEAGVIQNLAAGLLTGCTYSTLYEDVVPPQLVSASGLLASGDSQDKYSFSNYGDTVFTLEFSEKVEGAGTVTLVNGAAWSKTFGLGAVADESGVTSSVDGTDGRTVTLTVDGTLDAGSYTLTVPFASLTDAATETGVPGNAFEVSPSCPAPCLTASGDSATYTIVVAEAGQTAPTCTVASTDTEEVVPSATDISRTLVLQFEEDVRIRTSTSKLVMQGMNCTLADGCSAVDVLSITLGDGKGDSTFACENGATTSANDLGCDANTDAVLEFDWMAGCESATDGCQQAVTAEAPGGGHYLFLFLTGFQVKEQFTSYWFKFEHGNSLVNAHDYEVSGACAAKMAEFSVYDAVGNAAPTTVTLDNDASTALGSTENLLLKFNEKVKYNDANAVKVTFTFDSSDPTPTAGTGTDSKFGNVTHGIVLSASGLEAVVHVPYGPDNYPGNPTAFSYLTVQIKAGEFVDLALSDANSTAVLEATYNSTDINTVWDPNATSDYSRADAAAPKVLMILPGGADSNLQKLSEINTSATVYLVMSENVSLSGSGGVDFWNCGEYILARRDSGATGVAGFDNRPLVNADCTSDDATQETSATLTLLDNTYGSSVVEATPSSALKHSSKYYVKIRAGTFNDRAGNTNAEQPVTATQASFEFFTEASRTKPQVERYVYAHDSEDSPVSVLTGNPQVLEVWFNMPVAPLSETITGGLNDAGDTDDVDTTLVCNGGFRCVIAAAANLLEDKIYLVKVPNSIEDRESNSLNELSAAVSFRTYLADGTAPELIFCTGVTATATSLEFKVGFSEAIKLYGGYTEYTTTGTSGGFETGTGTTANAGDGGEVGATLQLEAGGVVLHVSSSASMAAATNYTLRIPAANIEDLAGNALGNELVVSTDGFNVDQGTGTATCFAQLLTSAAPDSAAPGVSSTLPAAGATTVHDGDYAVFIFDEEVQGVADKTLTLAHCGPESTAASCVGHAGANPASSGAAVESISATDLRFGGNTGNAMWQFDTALDQGSVYEITAEAGSFADLAGNAHSAAISRSFQVALEAFDYRGTASAGAISKGETYNANSVAYFTAADGTVSRLMTHELDTTQAQTLSIFLAQKVQGGAALKLYFNATVGTDYYQGTTTVNTAGNSLGLTIPADSLSKGLTYELHVYKNDADWSTDIFEDADTYYTHFGNYKASTAYSASYQQPLAARFDFQTASAPATVYYSTPTVSAQFKVGATPDHVNETAKLATSTLLGVDVTTNGTSLTVASNALKVHKSARIMASTYASGKTACDGASPDFELCCETTWSEDTSAQSHYVDYSAAQNRAQNADVPNYVAKVYFALEGGFTPTHCYRVAVRAEAFDDGQDDGEAPSAEIPDYISWFITDATSHDTDITGPALAAETPFTVSSEGVSSSFGLVARTAVLKVEFAEAVTAVNLALVTLNDGSAVTATSTLSGTTVTIKAAAVMAAGTAHTLTVGAGAVKDAAGNYLSDDKTFTFTTVHSDTDTPTMLHSLPETTDTASVDARAVFFMSESVKPVATKTAEAGGGNVDVTQSAWHGFQDGIDASTKGAVMVESTRVAFGWHLGLTSGAGATMKINADALTDQDAAHESDAMTVTFTAEGFGAFADATRVAATNPYGGDNLAEVEGATAVSCGETLFLVGGSSNTVSKWDGSAWSEGNGEGLGDRKFASVAVSLDSNATCTLWVVGGSGAATKLVRGVDGASFEEINPRPLPVTMPQADGSSLVSEGESMGADFEGASVVVANGWQVLVCGGGLSTCWVCKDAHCAVAGRSKPVPAAVQDRYYGSMLAVGGAVYYFGGLDAKNGAETRCHQSVYKLDVAQDAWTGVTTRLDLSSDAPQRCSSAFAQAGDGMIVALGGTNATASTKDQYSVGPTETGLKAVRPYRDSGDFEAGLTYADNYAAPVLVASGPSAGAVLDAASPVHLVFSEPVVAGSGCVTVAVGAKTLQCSAMDGKCYEDTCGGVPVPTIAAGSSVSIERSILTIELGTVAAGTSVTVTPNDNIVQDAHGNAFTQAEGSSTRGSAAAFTFSTAEAPAAFSGAVAQPVSGATGVELDTNLVFQFNRLLSESDSILSGFSLTVTPAVGDAVTFDENSTDHFTFVGDILKVSLSEGLTPGMEYTAVLSSASVTGADTAGSAGALSTTFTTRDGPPRGDGAAGVAFVVAGGELDSVEAEQNDTGAAAPTVTAISPPSMMTGVRTDTVHVVYTFSEAVRLVDAANKSNGVISEAFKLMFYNTTNPNSAHHEYDVDSDVTGQAYVNTTGRTISFALSDLKVATRYTIEFDESVVNDFGETTYGAAWTSIKNTIEGYYFTTVGAVESTAKPKVVASYISPVTSSDQIILGDEDDTTVMVVFDRPLDETDAIEPDCVVNPPDTPWCDLEHSMSEEDVLTVTIPDKGETGFAEGTSTWDLLLNGAEAGAHAVNMTAVLPTLVSLDNSFPIDTGVTYDKYSSDSTVVLEFSEDIQAHTGTAEAPALVTLEAQNDADNSLSFDFAAVDGDSKPYVTVVGKFLVIEPRGDDALMPGEQFRVSMTNGTVKGVTTATNGRPAQQKPTWTPENKQFATVAKIRFTADAALDQVQSGAAVAFGPDNALYIIGGFRSKSDSDSSLSDAVTNQTSRSATYRDTDAGAGYAKPEPCYDPCYEPDQDVQKVVFSDASVRGLRHKATSGVAFSVRGSTLADEQLEGACVCPTCIEAPTDEIPDWGNFFRGDETNYTQVDASGDGDSVQVLTCDVGLAPDLKPNQGYDATENFVCTIGPVTQEDDLAQYFGIWKIDPEACVPKNCLLAPTYPAASMDGTGTCEEFTTVDGNTTTYLMPHGTNCTVSCSPGYERAGVYACDRGIYGSEVSCTKRMCTHGPVENGELNAAEVPFDDAFTLTCDPGYKASRETANCVADTSDAESTVNAGEALQCEVQSCDGKPQVADSEAVECDSDPKYKSECTVRCKEGFRYGREGAQSQTGVVTCEAVEGSPSEVQWGAALECVPVTCAVPEPGDFTMASTAAQEPVSYSESLPLTCDQGYGTDATDVESGSYTALCTVDADYNSKYDDAGTACVPLDCEPLSSIAGGFTLGLSDGTKADEPFKAGSKSEFKCSTGKRVNDDYQYVTCIAGTITMCTTQDCTETTALSGTDTACMDKAAKTVTENRVNSEMTMMMDLAGRRLSASSLEDKKADLELAFRNGMATELDLPIANIQVTGTSFKSIPETTKVEVVISFYILVPSDKKVDDFESTLSSIAKGETELTQFQKSFEKDMAEAGLTLTVEDIKVAEPVVTAVQVAKPPPKDDADEEEGGGGAVIIVVVVLVVLAVVGLVVWKFVLKK